MFGHRRCSVIRQAKVISHPGKTRVWRETRTKRRCCAQGEHEWAEFLRPSVLAELLRLLRLVRDASTERVAGRAQRVNTNGRSFLGCQYWRSFRGCVSVVRATCRDWAEDVLRQGIRAGRRGREATLACICVRRVWAAGCGRFAMCGAGAESVARIRGGGYYDSQRLPQTQCKSSCNNNNNRWFIALVKHVVHTSTLSGPCSSFLSRPLCPFHPYGSEFCSFWSSLLRENKFFSKFCQREFLFQRVAVSDRTVRLDRVRNSF
jgi:hypothetical protein